MGFAPREVRAMTFWEFGHAVAAFAAFHGAQVGAEPTPDELRALDDLVSRAPETLT